MKNVAFLVRDQIKNVALLIRVSLAVSEKYPQTKTTPNYSVLQNVQPSDDNIPLTQKGYYHLLLLVGDIHIITINKKFLTINKKFLLLLSFSCLYNNLVIT